MQRALPFVQQEHDGLTPKPHARQLMPVGGSNRRISLLQLRTALAERQSCKGRSLPVHQSKHGAYRKESRVDGVDRMTKGRTPVADQSSIKTHDANVHDHFADRLFPAPVEV